MLNPSSFSIKDLGKRQHHLHLSRCNHLNVQTPHSTVDLFLLRSGKYLEKVWVFSQRETCRVELD